jgi:hypothetical protein
LLNAKWIESRPKSSLYFALAFSSGQPNHAYMATTRIANNTIFANINAYKTFVQRRKDDVKDDSKYSPLPQKRSILH